MFEYVFFDRKLQSQHCVKVGICFSFIEINVNMKAYFGCSVVITFNMIFDLHIAL